jgi:hypothetical protein
VNVIITFLSGTDGFEPLQNVAQPAVPHIQPAFLLLSLLDFFFFFFFF